MKTSEPCPDCGGQRVVAGHLPNPSAFIADETHFFLPLMSFSSRGVGFAGQLFACIDCGLVWTRTSQKELRERLGIWGTNELKQRLGLDQPSEVAPSGSPEGRGDEASPADEDRQAHRDSLVE